MMTHWNKRNITHLREVSDASHKPNPMSLGMMIGLAGLVLALASCFDDCFGHQVKVWILAVTGGSLVTLTAVYWLYRFEAHRHPHLVNPLIGILMGAIAVLGFALAGCSH